ncbi:hypothetical protein F7725_021748 [Dissostichus mawsoni]|uniref:Uncharacterized protein n=1 Tax=Dissostichus mawsoni TaxID=36200 RepID=A0A7J5ZED3_DISMA|nr:hypothetical protein F7725_021748 [Dissostichus mawsoni]
MQLCTKTQQQRCFQQLGEKWNSPLFQYLHDLGHTDFEACPTASQEDEYGGDLTPSDEDPHKTSELSVRVMLPLWCAVVLRSKGGRGFRWDRKAFGSSLCDQLPAAQIKSEPKQNTFSKAVAYGDWLKRCGDGVRISRLHLDGVFGQYSVKCILDQDVLLQEDVELIELLDPSLLTLSSSASGSSSRASTLPRPSLIAKPSLRY